MSDNQNTTDLNSPKTDDSQDEVPGVKSKKNKDKKKKNIVDVGGGITIDSSQPLPQYDRGPINAYKANGKIQGQGDIPLFAYICDRNPLPRLGDIAAIKSMTSYNMATLVSHGVVKWPSVDGERYAIVYKDNLGAPLLGRNDSQASAMSIEVVTEKILTPLVQAFRDLREKDIFHGAVHPANIWTSDKEAMSHVVLGDCLVTPPSYTQPAIYEVPNRAMADPIARGHGRHSDDMYALGVTLVMLMRKHPGEDLSDEEIIRKKIQIGSFNAITGNERFTGSTLELLRGLLHDDENERWSIDDVAAWLDGRRLKPRTGIKRAKATRPLLFSQKRYSYTETLAMDLSKDILELKRIISDGELDNWLQRAVEKKFESEELKTAELLAEQSTANNYDSALVCYMSMALDPRAPIRYKGKSLMPLGTGAALVEACMRQTDLQAFSEILSTGIINHFTREHDPDHVEAGTILARFDACQKFMKNAKSGSGLERAVYVLSPHVPCLSPKLKDYFVMRGGAIVQAYENAAKNEKLPKRLLDRHIIAFLFARETKLIEGFLRDFDSPLVYRQLIVELRVMAKLQEHFKTGPVPHLAKAMIKHFEPVYARFHDVSSQERIKKYAESYAEQGNLIEIAELVDSFDARERDRVAFFQAMKDYKKLVEDRKKLVVKLEDKDEFGKKTGRDIAATASCVLSILIILIITFIYFSSSGGF